MAMPSPKPPRNQVRSAEKMRKGELRLNPSAVKSVNKEMRESAKAGKPGSSVKATSSGFKVAKTNSPRKASVAGAANKVKAQGAKMNMTPSTTAAARARAAKKK